MHFSASPWNTRGFFVRRGAETEILRGVLSFQGSLYLSFYQAEESRWKGLRIVV